MKNEGKLVADAKQNTNTASSITSFSLYSLETQDSTPDKGPSPHPEITISLPGIQKLIHVTPIHIKHVAQTTSVVEHLKNYKNKRHQFSCSSFTNNP